MNDISEAISKIIAMAVKHQEKMCCQRRCVAVDICKVVSFSSCDFAGNHLI